MGFLVELLKTNSKSQGKDNKTRKEKNMKKYNVMADAGSVAVFCGESRIMFPNGYGDGLSKVYIFESEAEFANYRKDHLQYNIQLNDYKYITSCDFINARIMDYDCAKVGDKEVAILNGRYGIFSLKGKVYFEKWSDL